MALPCHRHRSGLEGWAIHGDRARLRHPFSPPSPALSPSCIRPIKKALTAKLDISAQFTGEFLLETRGPLTGNTMLPRAPARGWTFARQQMWADAQGHEIRAQAPLLGSAAPPRNPLLDTGDPAARQGEGQTVIARRRINLLRRIIKVSIRWHVPWHNHLAPPFRRICRSRCDDRPRLLTR
jgi:hypothetical protein